MAKVTIHDVADLAGVSIKTVSRVVNKESNVRQSTRDRVDEAIAELGYRPNPSARGLAGNRSYLLALFYDNPSANYVMKVQNGVLASCGRDNYGMVIHPCNYQTTDLAKELLNVVQQSNIDGVILTPPLSDMSELLAVFADEGIPVACIAPAEELEGVNVVTCDDRLAARQMTEYLLSMGHKQIGFIAGHPDHGAAKLRLNGALDAMQAAGLYVPEELIAQGYFSFESGRACAENLLNLENAPSAIFASNDDMAAGVVQVARERGLSVPGDLTVVGFDDSPTAQQLWPPMTTIRQPIQQMADRAAHLLVEQIRSHNKQIGSMDYHCELVLRKSSGEPSTAP